MKRLLPVISLLFFFVFSAAFVPAQTPSGVLTKDQVRKVVPASFFFRGQSATVQQRNSAGFSVSGKYVLAGLVDTSGYATDVQAKYIGFLITEVKLNVGGHELAPGEYGFGFKDGKFGVMDVASNDLLSADAHTDKELKRPVPLAIQSSDGGYKLYAGRQWVELKAE
jgi:hypothetical protein